MFMPRNSGCKLTLRVIASAAGLPVPSRHQLFLGTRNYIEIDYQAVLLQRCQKTVTWFFASLNACYFRCGCWRECRDLHKWAIIMATHDVT